MSKFWQWLVRSSSNPDELSATVKGLAGFIPSIIIVTSILHLNVGADDLENFIKSLALFVSGFTTVVTAVVSVFGFLRKLWTTARGTNQVILGFRDNR